MIGMFFLILSFAVQYGKLISYCNRKVTNSSDIGAIQCDYEKILTDTNDGDDDSLLSRGQATEKIDEWFNRYASLIVSPKYFNITGSFFSRTCGSSLLA